MAKKIDPLNKKQYGAVSAILTVSDIKAAVAFYQKAFGLCAEHVRQLGGESPLPNLVEVKG
jgi:predicted enzyme related to lactoylglutathione lyase